MIESEPAKGHMGYAIQYLENGKDYLEKSKKNIQVY